MRLDIVPAAETVAGQGHLRSHDDIGSIFSRLSDQLEEVALVLFIFPVKDIKMDEVKFDVHNYQFPVISVQSAVFFADN